MAMVIMAYRAPWAVSLYLLWLVLAYGCGQNPGVWVARGDEGLNQKGPLLYYQGKLLNGVCYQRVGKDTLSREPYREGRMHGVAYAWYNNKVLSEKRMYKKGKRMGIHAGYWENGALRFRYRYLNDLMHGPAEEWYPDGKRSKRMNYLNGREQGIQSAWDEEGRLVVNYEAKNGRNYGLIGQKLCKNTLNDEKNSAVPAH